MWMVLHHNFRVLHRESKCCCGLALSECRNGPPAKMDWAPMWALSEWCHTYDAPPLRKPFIFFDLDHSTMNIPKKYYETEKIFSQTLKKEIRDWSKSDWEDFNYMAYFEEHHTLYPPPDRDGKRCFSVRK